MKQKNSLLNKIWIYLIIFSTSIMGFLWFFQVLFLDVYYEFVKTNDVKKTAESIINNYENNNIKEILDTYSFKENICIDVVYKNMEIYSSNNLNRGCIGLNSKNQEVIEDKLEFQNSNKTTKLFKYINREFKNKIVMYAIKLDEDTYMYINSSVEILSSTTNILGSQLIYVTLLVLILSLVISYFISKVISKPIIKINESAKKMANGDYKTKFEIEENIQELNELVDTLNETCTELSKTDEVRRELLANVSHDLKTPLTMIKAYSEMIKDISYDDKEKTFEYLNTIIDETNRLNLLVNDILDLSKLQSNIEQLNIETIDINNLIQSIVDRFKYSNIDIEFNGINNVLVEIDKKKIEQVIYNLISNAINYVGEDNKVIVNLLKKKDYYEIEVIDHGSGINEKDLEFIWDKYYKTDKTHNRNNVGTGLGLSIVKNILEQHNFEYGVKSKKNKGTTFYFRIKR